MDPKCEAWAFGSHGSLSPITVTAKHKRELCLDQSWKPTTVNIVTLLWKNGHTGNRNKCDMLSHKQTHTPTYGHSRGLLEVAAFSQLIDLKVEWHSHRRAHTRKRTQTHIRQLWELVEVNLGGQAFHSLPAETKHPTPSPSLTCRAFFSCLIFPFLDLSSFVTLLAWDAMFFPFSSYLDYMRAHGGSCCINLASRKMETPVNPTKQPCSRSNCISAEVVTYTLFSLRGVCDAVVLAVSQTERGKAVY